MKRRGIKQRLDVRLCLGVAFITLLSACAKPPDAEAPGWPGGNLARF